MIPNNTDCLNVICDINKAFTNLETLKKRIVTPRWNNEYTYVDTAYNDLYSRLEILKKFVLYHVNEKTEPSVKIFVDLINEDFTFCIKDEKIERLDIYTIMYWSLYRSGRAIARITGGDTDEPL